MILEYGDMWQIFNRTDLFCITTNSTIKKNGSLVMGRGIALQAKNKLLGIDMHLGRLIASRSYYGLIVTDRFKPQKIGIFQVKCHWKDKANLDLIHFSVKQLTEYISAYKPSRVDLNFPGIGNGGLSKDEVLPLLIDLPDCVHVWRFE